MFNAMPTVSTFRRKLGLGLFGVALTTFQAVTSAGQFSVNIALTSAAASTAQQSAPGVCISQTLSERTNATVRIVCGTNQFVSITANPKVRFLGTHGGAFNYSVIAGNRYLDSTQDSDGGASAFYPGTGTVTSWRIYNVNGLEELLEVLLTF